MIEPADDLGEFGVMDVEPQQMFVGVAHIGGIVAIEADALGDQANHLVFRQPPGILDMRAVDDIGEGLGAAAVDESHAERFLQIDRGDEFAFAQIANRFGAVAARDLEGDALAGAAAIEPQHQPRPLRRAAMDMREDAQRAVIAVHPGERAVDEVEARPPHQRPVAEHPEIFVPRTG